MEQMIDRLEKQLFVLDTELYSIRCFMGETVQFVQLRSGRYADIETPVVLYQKIRYLDEEMGKFLAVYDFDAEDKSLFEEVLQHRDDLFSLFAPPEKSISLIRISRNCVQYGSNPAVANMLTEYVSLHGAQIGILVRDGENLWIGWTEHNRIHISEDAFLNPKTDVTTVEDSGSASTKKEIASRYFIFSILQGVIHNNKMLRLPEGTSVFRKSAYVAFSMADGWLEDNRFGTFSDIVERTNQQLQAGDVVLTTIRITRDDRYAGRYGGVSTYLEPWHNDRGRGDRNRTHDASIPDKTILPVNEGKGGPSDSMYGVCIDTSKSFFSYKDSIEEYILPNETLTLPICFYPDKSCTMTFYVEFTAVHDGKEITIKSDPITLEFEVLSIGGNGIYHATEYSEYDLKKISYEERGFCLVSYPFIDKFAIQVLDELAKQYD